MKPDKKTIALLSTWGVTAAMFFVTAVICISFIFAGVTSHTKRGEGEAYQEYYSNAPAISIQGLIARAETWKEYPQYNIGLGIAAFLCFNGAGWCIFNIYRSQKA